MNSPLIQEVETALQQENFSLAIQKAKQLIEADPNDHNAYLLYGDVFMQMDNWAKAVENYEKALSISPDDAHAFFKLGNAYESQENYQAALNQYQTARRLAPANKLYAGYFGNLLYKKGSEAGNINFTSEGVGLMEQTHQAGEADEHIREGLAIAYLEQATATWRKHPENKDEWLATEFAHLQHAKNQVAKAKALADGANISVNNRIAELESHLADIEKRKFAGYNYIVKAPVIAGIVLFLLGFHGIGIFVLALAALYYVSQFKPVYMLNRMYYKNDYRDPFIIRRLNALSEEFSGLYFFGSLSQIFFMKALFNLLFGALRYGMVIMMLPYEIIKGFVVNYQLSTR